MYRSLVPLLAAAVLCTSSERTATAETLSTREIVQKNKEAVIFIEVTGTDENGVPKEANATGIMVSSSGHLITARHILYGKNGQRLFDQYKIMGAAGSRYEYLKEIDPRPIVEEPNSDLMLLKFRGNRSNYKKVNICDGIDLEPGDELVSLGFPKGSELSVINGILSNTSADQGLYQTNVDFIEGYSGGPVFDRTTGSVVGIVMSGTAGVSGRNFFAPVGSARNLLDHLPGKVSSHCPADARKDARQTTTTDRAPSTGTGRSNGSADGGQSRNSRNTVNNSKGVIIGDENAMEYNENE
jgi:serine protease Do